MCWMALIQILKSLIQSVATVKPSISADNVLNEFTPRDEGYEIAPGVEPKSADDMDLEVAYMVGDGEL